MANVDSFSYELPAPYTLQRGNNFAMDFRYNAAFVDPQQTNFPDVYVIMAGLHGYGLIDKEPISLMKPVRGWPNAVGAANQWQTIVFDDEQGRPMRDAVITHMSFGSSETTNISQVLEAIEFRPHAPEGPAWHIGEFFSIRNVASQVGHTSGFDYYCIHRPIVPYSLLPGERLQVEIWNSLADDVAVDVTLLGTQRVRG